MPILLGPALALQPFFGRILYDAACGLLHIHEHGKVHRDIKAGNIIVAVDMKDGSAIGKVADFGLTCGEGHDIVRSMQYVKKDHTLRFWAVNTAASNRCPQYGNPVSRTEGRTLPQEL